MIENPVTFEDFFTNYNRAFIDRVLRKFSYRFNWQDAADVVQDTWIVAQANWDACEEPDKRAAWLMGILHNHIRRVIRRRCRKSEVVTLNMDDQQHLEEMVVTEEDPEVELAALQSAIEFDVSMQQLDEHNSGQYEVVYLIRIYGLSQQACADRLGIPLNTVKSRLSRGLAFIGADTQYGKRRPRAPKNQPTLVAGVSIKSDHPWYQKHGLASGPEYRESRPERRPNHYEIGGPTVEPKCPGYRKCPVCANFPDKDTMQ